MPTSNRIAVTGVGVVAPFAGTAIEAKRAALAGTSGVKLVPTELWDRTPIHLHAPVADTNLTRISTKERRRLDRCAQLALQAGREAWEDAAVPEVDPERLVVVASAGLAGLQTILYESQRWQERWEETGSLSGPAYAVPSIMPNAISALLALDLGARGGAFSSVSACASGAESIARGVRILQDDDADVVLVGGAEAAIHPMTLCAFAGLRVLSNREQDPAAASRPFERDRDGFVMGEGAAMLVLEKENHARARGADVYATFLGAGQSCDAFHIVSPEPEGRGAALAIRRSLHNAGVQTTDIGFVSTHAAGTKAGDLAEARALSAVLGAHASSVPVSALKSQIGHLLGASGALSAAVTVLCARDGVMPGTLNLDNIDEEIELMVIGEGPHAVREDSVFLVNTFAFGGHNVVLVAAAP